MRRKDKSVVDLATFAGGNHEATESKLHISNTDCNTCDAEIGHRPDCPTWLNSNTKRIKYVMIFKNGVCAVFDYDEQQVGWLQGNWKEQYSLVMSQIDEDTLFFDERYED